MQTHKLRMQATAVALLHKFTDLLHPKPQANKAMVIPSLELCIIFLFYFKSSNIYVWAVARYEKCLSSSNLP